MHLVVKYFTNRRKGLSDGKNRKEEKSTRKGKKESQNKELRIGADS